MENMIVIGASVGGLNALKQVLSSLPSDFPVPIIVTQHLMPSCDDSLINLLNDYCQLNVEYAENGTVPKAGNVYFAQPDYHLRIDKAGVLMLSQDDKVMYSRPSIDVLFESASFLQNCQVIAIVLTGTNSDGAKGAKAVQQNGGKIIVQKPETAEEPIMPQAVIDLIKVDDIIRLDQIGPFIWDMFAKRVS